MDCDRFCLICLICLIFLNSYKSKMLETKMLETEILHLKRLTTNPFIPLIRCTKILGLSSYGIRIYKAEALDSEPKAEALDSEPKAEALDSELNSVKKVAYKNEGMYVQCGCQ